MKLSKNQIVLAATGGVTAVAVLVLGYLLYGAYASGAEAAEELETMSMSVRQLTTAKVAPTAASLKAIASNQTAMVEWREAMLAALADGDVAFTDAADEATFKQQMVDDARVLAKLPGARDGVLVAPDFAFGFKDYITGGELPSKDALPRLRRQWFDIKLFVNQLAACGVAELTKVEPQEAKVVSPAEPEKRPGMKKPPKKNAKAEKPDYSCESYVLEFRARPWALVKAINALSTMPRFTVVDSFEFFRPNDMIGTALAGDDQQAEVKTSRRRRRRNEAEEGAEAEAETTAAKARKGLVNDPLHEDPFVVRLKLSTYDFGTKEVAE